MNYKSKIFGFTAFYSWKLVISIFLAIPFLNYSGYSQGCSDAGFCTMGAMRPDQSYSLQAPIRLKSIEVSYYRGKTTLSPVVSAAVLDFNLIIKEKLNVQFKIPYQRVKGNFGTTNGVGDISLSVTRNVYHSNKFDLNLTLGSKIPTNDATKKLVNPDNGEIIMYPMYYQISLGTYDLILGASVLSKKWLFAIGYQQPLIHINKNRFQHNPIKWSFYPSFEYVQRYDVNKDLKRGADVMFRVERNWRFSNFNFNLGLLPIYRVSKDQIKNASEQYFKLNKSTGLALSALAGVGYMFNVKNNVKLIYGLKLKDRDVNPDGLTRHSVLIVGYQYKF